MALSFKVDEDLPTEVAQRFRRAGFDATTVVEQSLGGSSDDAIWDVIQRERRCLVTADKGFANAQLHPPGTHAGIICFDLHVKVERIHPPHGPVSPQRTS